MISFILRLRKSRKSSNSKNFVQKYHIFRAAPPPKPVAEEINDESLTEAEKAMMAAKRRQDEEDMAKLQDYEAKRKAEREREEEELRKLKEKVSSLMWLKNLSIFSARTTPTRT
jgi:hypothetical protein